MRRFRRSDTVISDSETKTSGGSTDYGQLHRELAQAVDRICPRWLADRADDIVQVAVMRVMEIQRKQDGTAELNTFYLRRAAYSAMIAEIRRMRRRQEVSLLG